MSLSSFHGKCKLGISRLLVEIEKGITLTACSIKNCIWHFCTGEMIGLQPKRNAISTIYHQCHCLKFHTSLCADILHTLQHCCHCLVDSDVLAEVCVSVPFADFYIDYRSSLVEKIAYNKQTGSQNEY